MALSDMFMVVPNAAASVAIWFVVLAVILYFARQLSPALLQLKLVRRRIPI